MDQVSDININKNIHVHVHVGTIQFEDNKSAIIIRLNNINYEM